MDMKKAYRRFVEAHGVSGQMTYPWPRSLDTDPVYLAPIPDGIRVNCGDLHRVKEMTPKAMRGFALRLLEMAEGRDT